MGEILATGPKSKKVTGEVSRLVAALGPELSILRDVPLEEISRVGGSLLGEGIGRLRRSEVIRDAGYDGEYGTIRLFQPGELDEAGLFAVTGLAAGGPGTASRPGAGAATGSGTGSRTGAGPAAGSGTAAPTGDDPAAGSGIASQAGASRIAGRGGATAAASRSRRRGAGTGGSAAGSLAPSPADPSTATGSVLDGLDPDQRAAATADAPLLIIAGPGTGKTRTLTHRIAYQIGERGVPARQFLAITFTRRAAEELAGRLAALCPRPDEQPTVTTFHGLGLRILREHRDLAGLPAGFGVADEAARLAAATELAGSERDGRRLLAGLDPDGKLALRRALLARDLVDFDGLVELAAALLGAHPDVAARLRARWPQVSVDEYQDIDAVQYDLVRAISGDGAGLTAIGDPDQAIYGFRGADVSIFGRFGADFPAATTVELTRNYRSSPPIVTAAAQAIAPSTLVPGRTAVAVRTDSFDTVTFHEAADEYAEASWIAAMVDKLLGGASFHALDTGRADGHEHGKLGLADIAVLYRTDGQAGPLGQALTRAGLPFQKRSHDLLARRAGVTEVVREIRLVGAEVSAAGPRGPEGPGGPGSAGDVIRRLTAAVQAVARARGERDPAVVDIRAAGELLTPLARRCGTDLERFLAEIGLGAETDAMDPRAEAITLLTLHGAKGLEFDVVFLAGCERGLLPLRLPGSGPLAGADEAEERRLLFVGMTRARGKLLLSCAARRTRHGSEEPAGRSPFLAAVDPGLLGAASTSRPRRTGDRQLRLL
jgi:superfamily I DNA/RNA helicase